MNSITPYLFGENTVRTSMINHEPWFVAKDVCSILGLENNSQAVTSLRDHEKGVTISDPLSPGGAQEIRIISESGLYRLIFKSRKAEAIAFQDWVFTEVLPQIRRTGSYGSRTMETATFLRELLSLGFTAKDAGLLVRHTFAPMTRKDAIAEKAAKQLPQVETDPLREELEILRLMKDGECYSIPGILDLLPRDHRVWLPTTPRGRHTALGRVMGNLITLGKVEKVSKRHGVYRLTAKTNIVQMK